MNAATAVAALYVIIIYLAEMNGLAVNNHESKYITSKYGYAHLLCKAGDGLPDFKKD